MSAAVELSGVTVRRGGRVVLEAVDAVVEQGALAAIVGPNGAGKSTLLGVMAGDIRPESGAVAVRGVPIERYRARELARERAMLTQENAVTFPFTVADVVAMGRSPWAGAPEADDDERIVRESLATVDMQSLAARRFTQLSGGERARASLGRVLAQRTPLVLLDEPTAALDLKHQEAVLGTARTLCREGRTVVVVLHDLSLAAAYADVVLMLSHGALRAAGAPEAVFTSAALSEVYDIEIAVVPHPVSGELLIQPVRATRDGAEPIRC